MRLRSRANLMLAALLLIVALLSACGVGGGSEETTAAETSETAVKTEESKESESGGEAAPKEKIELDFWTFWASETRRPIIEKIVEDFNNSQDEIVVKHTPLPWGDIWTKNLAAIAAGNPPDVIVNDINTVANRAVNNQVVDLTGFIETDGEDIKNRFFPELWNTVVHEEKVYALPFNTDTRFLYYNKDAFREAGLDPEKPPTTWAELEEYAVKLDKKNGNRYERIGFYPLWGNWGWDNWMMNADGGVGFVDKDGNVTIDTPNKVAALEWINRWTERLGQPTVDAFKAEFGSQQANPFIAGKVAMFMELGTFYTQLRDYGQHVDFGMAPVPEKEPGSGHYSAGGGFVVEIPYGAKNPEASWKFLKYLTDVQAQEYWAIKNFDNVANVEASEKAAANPELDEKGKAVYAFAVENLKVTKLFPIPPYAADYRSLLNPQADAALLKQAAPADALKKAQADVEQLIQSKR